MTSWAQLKPGDKDAGSLMAFIRMYQKLAKLPAEERYARGVNVPCQGCTRCCRSKEVHVDLTEAEAREFPCAFDEEIGRFVLAKRDSGECVYLIDDKCSIYDQRPGACRGYDCRWMLALGWAPDNDPVMQEAVAQWQPFRLPTIEDKEMHTALRLAVLIDGPPLPDGFHEMMLRVARARNDPAKWARCMTMARNIRQELESMTGDERKAFADEIEKTMHKEAT